MSEASARLGLPFILPGQAQKEVFHNEALTRIDIALAPSVQALPLAEPPATPAVGESFIVAAGASDGWVGKDYQLASWTGGGWRFVTPVPGMRAWVVPQGYWLHWDGSGWRGAMPAASFTIGGQQVVGARQPQVPSPSGGTVIDTEARATLDAVIAALMSHGLID